MTSSPPSNRDKAIGCGCTALIFAGLAPFATYWIGLTGWTPALLLAAFTIMLVFKHDDVEGLSWKLAAAMCIAAVPIALFFGFVSERGQEESEQRRPESKPTDTGAIAVPGFGEDPKPQPSPSPPPERDGVPPDSEVTAKPFVKVEIDEVLQRYARNQVGAADYFNRRTALISARVVRVREALGTGIVVAQSLRTKQQMELSFTDSGTRQLIDLSPGDKIEATCPTLTEMLAEVIVVCTAVKTK